MKINLVLFLSALLSNQILCNQDFNGIDYLPATEAFTSIKSIQSEYETFRQKVAKNVSIDYSRCVEIIKSKKCNNIDQWQSVIEELKLQTQNSIDVEVPFLKKRKAHKVDRLKQLIEMTDQYDNDMLQIVGKLSTEQTNLYSSEFEVNTMYKLPLPEPIDPQLPIFSQQDINVPQQLNSDLTPIAKQELTEAKSAYETNDLSIEAEAARDELHSAGDRLTEVIKNLQQAFDYKQMEILEEKRQLKDDIIRLRALIAGEEELQQRNTEKIAEIEGRIAGCQGQPMNIEKDCEPIRIRADKINTEIDIIMTRTMKLYKQVGLLMDENESDEEVEEKKQELEVKRKAAEEKAEEMRYVVEQDPSSMPGPYSDPKERKPMHHLKENLEE